jgi:hypothetical protein
MHSKTISPRDLGTRSSSTRPRRPETAIVSKNVSRHQKLVDLGPFGQRLR